MLLVANLANTKNAKKHRKITETLAKGYSSESTRRELSNEYQDDRVSMVFQESCILVLWTKVVSALEGLNAPTTIYIQGVGLMSLSNYRWKYSFHELQFNTKDSSSVSPFNSYTSGGYFIQNKMMAKC